MMEKRIEQITGAQVCSAYVEMYEAKPYDEKTFQHFANRYEIDLKEIISAAKEHKPIMLSLNKNNYLGKKTRAILKVLNWQEPKTLGMLFEKLFNQYSA